MALRPCFLLSFLIIILNTKAFPQNKVIYSKEINSQIQKVENNLLPWAQAGTDTLKFNIYERMAQYKIQGLSIAVIRNYKIIWAKAYGWADVKEKRPVTNNTLFQAASLSKSINAIGLLKLAQEGKIDLNQDINTYLTIWKFPYDSLSGSKKITTANLLSHTAGLTVHGFKGYTKGESIPTLPEILDGSKPANSPPVRSMYPAGKKVEYSGGGTTISQLILEDLTKEKYQDYMYKNVLQPMGMTQSFFNQPPASNKTALLATGYRLSGQEMEGGKYNMYPEMGAAGLWTTPTDIGKYIIETQLAYKGESAKVLNQEMTRLRLAPFIDSINAFGVYINKKGTEKYFQHSGSNEGFVAQYRGSLENGNGVVVMVNSDNTNIMNEIINSVAKIYNWKDFYQPVRKDTITLSQNSLDKYIGTYKLDGNVITITKKNNQLWLNNIVNSPMYFTSALDFYITEYKADYSIILDDKGQVNGFSINKTRIAEKQKDQ
ncbi:MAG: serine hydrolase [Taibaiella sp.]|jgi:CubicO group peptidase (beta-lactamase class C family)